MPDNKNITQPLDARRININEPYEVTYWCNKFGCTEQKLKEAVKKVGDSVEAVKKYLGK